MCPRGKYGQHCSQDCRCAKGSKCNPENGQCICEAGKMGTRCELGNKMTCVLG